MELKPGGVDAAAEGAKRVGGIEGGKGVGRGEKQGGGPGGGLAPQCQVQIPGGRPTEVQAIEAMLPGQMIVFPKGPLKVQPGGASGDFGDRNIGGLRELAGGQGVLVSHLQGEGTETGLAHQSEAVEVPEPPGTEAGRPAPQRKVVIIPPDQGSLGRCRTGGACRRPQGQEDCRTP